jgi:hypothetical protein
VKTATSFGLEIVRCTVQKSTSRGDEFGVFLIQRCAVDFVVVVVIARRTRTTLAGYASLRTFLTERR